MFFSGFENDDENELPGSTDWFKLDGEVGLGRGLAKKRAERGSDLGQMSRFIYKL